MIDKFEKQNPTLSINVFGYEKESIYPLRLSRVEKMPINLLLIDDGEKQHYTLIKNMSRLLSKKEKLVNVFSVIIA